MSMHPCVLVGGPKDGQCVFLPEKMPEFKTPGVSDCPFSENVEYTMHNYRKVVFFPEARGGNIMVHSTLSDIEAFYHIVQGFVDLNNLTRQEILSQRHEDQTNASKALQLEADNLARDSTAEA